MPGTLAGALKVRRKSHDATVPKVCVLCATPFKCAAHRASIAKYCGRKCYYKSLINTGSVAVPCAACGKMLRRPPSRSYPTACCDAKCRSDAMKIAHPRPKRATNARKWAQVRGRLTCCERCGYAEHQEILVIHHRDRDRKNNEASNLECLCPNCHALEHYAAHRRKHAA